MKTKSKFLATLSLAISVLLVTLLALNGCKKEPEPAPPTSAEQAVTAAIEQKTCPIMGLAINKKFVTEYKGKKVYFCCAMCKPKFEADPEKYLAKLPQFKD